MNALDLHGERHEAARNILIRTIEELWDSGEDLVIVTGNSWMMKDIVKKVLEEYKLAWVDGDPYNSGYLKITL